jgi:hypothetical protein
MYSPIWEAADVKLLKSCRHCSGLSETEFARTHSISVLQLRELEGHGAGRFYSDDIKARAGLRILSKYGHVKYLPPLVVRNELRPDRHRVPTTQEETSALTQRNRREVTMLGSCAALVMGVFVMLPQIEGKADAQLADQQPVRQPGVQYANTLTGQRAVAPGVPAFSLPAAPESTIALQSPPQPSDQAPAPLVPDALPATAAGPNAGLTKRLTDDVKKNVDAYFQVQTPEMSKP